MALAQLQGADLRFAQLQSADLRLAVLRGADLRFAVLSGADLRSLPVRTGRTELVDLRGARGTPLNAEQLAEIREVLGKTIANREVREARIEHAGNAGVPPPIFESCLIDPKVTPELDCKQKWLPAEVDAFRQKLFPVLEEVACESPAIAGGLMRQITLTDELRSFIAGVPHQQPSGVDSNVEMRGRIWLAAHFVTLLDKRECQGLSSLPEEDKDQIRGLAKSSLAREVLPLPNLPPAIAPEMP